MVPNQDSTARRVYNGTREKTIVVERPVSGPTGRTGADAYLYELTPTGIMASPGRSFTWGYSGRGAELTSDVVLTDALGGPPSVELREDFLADVVMHLSEEWRLSRAAILRWVRGWCAYRGMTNLPEILHSLPPVDDHAGLLSLARYKEGDQLPNPRVFLTDHH